MSSYGYDIYLIVSKIPPAVVSILVINLTLSELDFSTTAAVIIKRGSRARTAAALLIQRGSRPWTTAALLIRRGIRP